MRHHHKSTSFASLFAPSISNPRVSILSQSTKKIVKSKEDSQNDGLNISSLPRPAFIAERDKIYIMTKRISDLESKLKAKEKQLQLSEQLTKFQLLASQQKDQILTQDRKELSKLRSLLSRTCKLNISIKQASDNQNVHTTRSIQMQVQQQIANRRVSTVISPSLISINENKQFEDQPITPNDSFHKPSKSSKQNNPLNGIDFYLAGETFKATQLLNLNLKKEDALFMYNQDGCINFLNQLIADDVNTNTNDILKNRFFEVIANAGSFKLQVLLEKLKRIMSDHRHMFHLALRLKAIVRASFQMVSSDTLDEALQKIVYATSDALQCDRATCFMVDEAKGELWSKVAQGLGNRIKFPITQGIAEGHAASQKEIVNIQNAYLDNRFNQKFDQLSNYKTKTILALPILDKQQCIGVLQCINKFEGIFTKEDEQLLEMLGDLASIVLKNIIKHKEQMQAQNKFRVALKAQQQLIDNCRDLAQLLKTSESAVRKLMNIDMVRISLSQEKDSIIQVNEKGEFQKFPTNVGIVGSCMKKGDVFISLCCYQDVNFHPQIDLSTNLPVLCYPIRDFMNNQIFGAIQFININGVGKRQSINQLFLNNSEIGQRLSQIENEMIEKFLKQFSFAYFVWEKVQEIMKKL